MAADICGQPVPDCRTIDFTAEEALLNAREAFDPASLHIDTFGAVTNLRSRLGSTPPPATKGVMIVGHGSPGLIVTGTGLLANDIDKRIEKSNRTKWRRSLRDLKTEITELTFCSCDTGAEQEGADLLMMVRDVVKATVSGFTGLIFIDDDGNVTCEEGGQWQRAVIGSTLAAVPSPEHPIEGDMDSLKLKDQGKFITVPISQVSQITYSEPQTPPQTQKREESREEYQKGKEPQQREESQEEYQKGQQPEKITWEPRFSLEGIAAQQLVRTVNFANPQEIKAAPMAVVTANFEVKIDQRSWRFIVYNNRLLQDESATDTFYYASRDFIKRVREHLEPRHDKEKELKSPHREKPADDKQKRKGCLLALLNLLVRLPFSK